MLPDEPSEEELQLAPEAPEVPEVPDAEDAPPELQRQFWRLVLLFNFALFACSLGLLFAVFEGRLRNGGALVVVGVGVFGYAYRDYQRVTAESQSASEDKA